MLSKYVFGLVTVLLLTVSSYSQVTNNFKKLKRPTILRETEKDSAVMIILKTDEGSALKKSTANRGIFDLTDKGQKALIEAYKEKEQKSDAFRTKLSENLEKRTSPSRPILDRRLFTFYRKLDFDIQDNWVKKSPSNRITSLRITLTLKENKNVKIKGFKDFQTKYETITLGTLENTSTRNFSFGAGIGYSQSDTSNSYDGSGNQLSSSVSGLTPSVNTSFGTSNSRTENTTLTRRIISESGSTTENRMIVYLEGTAGRNLNGPLSIELELEVEDKYPNELEYVNFFEEKKDGGNVGKLAPRYLVYPKVDTDIFAVYEYEWVYRKIIRRGRFSLEGEHIVSYYEHSPKPSGIPNKGNVVFLEKKSLIDLDVFEVNLDSPGLAPGLGRKVFIKKGNFEPFRVRFLSDEEAIKFIWHLVEKNINKIDGFNLVTFDGVNVIPIPLTDLKYLSITKDNTDKAGKIIRDELKDDYELLKLNPTN